MVSLSTKPWACLIFYLMFPETPVFYNTAVKEVLGDSEIATIIEKVVMVFDFLNMAACNYLIFYTMLILGMSITLYCGELLI